MQRSLLPRSPGPLRTRRRGRAGLSMIEVLVGMTLLTIGLLGYLQVLVGAVATSQLNREQTRALEAAREVMERLQATPRAEIFASFNSEPADDPGGPGTAPGAGFAVNGLDPQRGDADGLPGEIVFPEVAGELREDVVDPTLSMPRDLNGDGFIDALDHAADWRSLPVLVRVRWRGRSGDAQIDLRTMLGGP